MEILEAETYMSSGVPGTLSQGRIVPKSIRQMDPVGCRQNKEYSKLKGTDFWTLNCTRMSSIRRAVLYPEIFNKKSAGFTLVELMIVIGIIASLAAIAMPQYKNYKKAAMQAEPALMLRHLMTAQEAYKAENGEYVRDRGQPCSDPISECTNRLGITKGDILFYEEGAGPKDCMWPPSDTPTNNFYYRSRLGFVVTDCRKLRYGYSSNGYYHIGRELGTTTSDDDRRVFPGCTDKYDTWVLHAETNELRHRGTANSDHNVQTTTQGYDANSQCL